jgi:hypothetical protein
MFVVGSHYSALLARQSAHVINTKYFPVIYCTVISGLHKRSLKQRAISSKATAPAQVLRAEGKTIYWNISFSHQSSTLSTLSHYAASCFDVYGVLP